MTPDSWWQRVYLPYGTRAHLLPGCDTPNSYAGAACGQTPVWPTAGWYGTGSQHERDRVERLPVCKGCARRAERRSYD